MTIDGREVGAWLVAAAVALLVASRPLAAQGVRWTGSLSYTTGSYVFDARTHTVALSNGLSADLGRARLSGSLPVYLQNSTLVSQVAGVPLPTGGQYNGAVADRRSGAKVGSGPGGGGSGSGSASGGSGSDSTVVFTDSYGLDVGDPFLTVSGSLFRSGSRSLEARVSTKVPVRSLDSGVGTGEWDVGLGGSALAEVGGLFLFGDVAYWWYGDLPDLELVDGVTYGGGVSHALLDGRASVMVSFLGASRLIESMHRPASVGVSLGYLPSSGRGLSLGVAFGLSEASPDVSTYLGWGLPLVGR